MILDSDIDLTFGYLRMCGDGNLKLMRVKLSDLVDKDLKKKIMVRYIYTCPSRRNYTEKPEIAIKPIQMLSEIQSLVWP